MAVTVASFRRYYPAFRDTPEDLIAAKLELAALQVGSNWGALQDTGTMLYLAHLLSVDPSGERARQTNDPAMTTYAYEFQRLEAQVACGLNRVT